jgi:hypothetical protein
VTDDHDFDTDARVSAHILGLDDSTGLEPWSESTDRYAEVPGNDVDDTGSFPFPGSRIVPELRDPRRRYSQDSFSATITSLPQRPSVSSFDNDSLALVTSYFRGIRRHAGGHWYVSSLLIDTLVKVIAGRSISSD